MNAVSNPGHGEVDLKDLAKVFWRSKKSLAVCVLVLTTLAAVYAYTAPVVYKATVLLIPSEQEQRTSTSSGIGAALSLVGLADQGARDVPQLIVRMKSRAMLEGFIKEHGLLSKIFHDKWDPKNHRWTLDREERAPTTYDAYGVLSELLEVTNDETANVIEANIVWPDRQQAAAWLNSYIAYFNQRMFEEEARRVALKETYLTRKMQASDLQASQQIIVALLQHQIAEELRLQNPREYVFTTIDPAYVPNADQPAWPKKKLIISIGFVAGVFMWLLYVMVKIIISPPSRRGLEVRSVSTSPRDAP